MTFGLSSDGWSSKRLEDILSESTTELSLIEDPQTGNKLNPNFNSDDPAMQVVKVPLNQTSLGWEAAQLAYNQYNPSFAVGPSVDGIAEITGIERLEAQPAVIEISLVGTIGATLLAGRTISDEFDTLFFTTDETIIFEASPTISTATSTVTGSQIITTGTITKIVTPSSGWDSVDNTAQLSTGRAEEEGDELEARRKLSNAAPSAAPVDSVFANLSNLPGAEYVRVYINNTLVTDARGIPAKQQAVIIQGADDNDIARTILARSGATADFFGSTSVILMDIQNEPTTIKFSRPIPVVMTVVVDISITNASLYPSNAPEQIKENIVTYAKFGSDALGTTVGFNEDGFPPGEDVIISRLYTPINSVPGHKVNSITVNGGTIDVSIDFNEVSDFDVSNITVTVS